MFQLLWLEFIIKSSCLFRWVVLISGLYSEHMPLVSSCWLRLLARFLACVVDIGWMRLDECPFLSTYLLIFFPAFMWRIIPLFDWYSLFLLILLRLIVDWIIGWLWAWFADGDHLTSLFIIKIGQCIVVINWFWWISRL